MLYSMKFLRGCMLDILCNIFVVLICVIGLITIISLWISGDDCRYIQ